MNSNIADYDERVNGRNLQVEEVGVVLPVVVASEMVPCGGREEGQKVATVMNMEGEREL